MALSSPVIHLFRYRIHLESAAAAPHPLTCLVGAVRQLVDPAPVSVLCSHLLR